MRASPPTFALSFGPDLIHESLKGLQLTVGGFLFLRHAVDGSETQETRSRQAIAIILRSGKRDARVLSATQSCASLNVGTKYEFSFAI